MNVPMIKELRKWCVSVSEAALILMDVTVMRSTGILYAQDSTKLMKRLQTDAASSGLSHAIETVVVSFHSLEKTRVYFEISFNNSNPGASRSREKRNSHFGLDKKVSKSEISP